MWVERWATIFGGGFYSTSASVNRLTEAFALEKLPRLIDINRGGHLKIITSVNRLNEVVSITVSFIEK